MSETLPTDGYILGLEAKLAFAKKLKGLEEEQKRLAEETKTAVIECQQAQAAASQAKREKAQLDKQIADARAEIEHLGEQKSNLIDETTERARAQHAAVKKDLEKLRIVTAQERKSKIRELSDLDATIEQKRKAVTLLEANRRDLEGGAATIESNAIVQMESINRNRIAQEREVGDLQARKIQLTQDVKLLQTNREEAKRYVEEKQQAADSAHRAKLELQAINDQLEAQRQELIDLSKKTQMERELAAGAAEAKRLLGRELENLKIKIDASRRKDKQDEARS